MEKNHYPHPILAREGWPFIGVALVVALLMTWLAPAWSLIFWIGALLVVQRFREPARVIPAAPTAVLSPADGRVVAIEKASDPYAGRDALKISVLTGTSHPYANRISVDGVVQSVQSVPGRFGDARLDQASRDNTRNALVIRTPDAQLVTLVQVAGQMARRILCYVKPGDVLSRGQRYGFIRFGSRLDVYLPAAAHPRVAIGDKVNATSTVLADMPAVPSQP
jgi:phosphatidylserine decarboxylase